MAAYSNIDCEIGLLKTGTYIITNARSRNHPALLSNNKVVQKAMTQSDNDFVKQMLWKVTAIDNGRYTIQSMASGTSLPYVVTNNHECEPGKANEITTWLSTQEWNIIETSNHGRYIIQHVDAVELWWAISKPHIGEAVLLLKEAPTNPRNQWEFCPHELPFFTTDLLGESKPNFQYFNDADEGMVII
ncbi:hypothetical protein BD410DRAFT_806823 [Rickenella mellea]|uniref:Ricin B lectin domain-containing protein n=1 Tax=Rickenella mellea TaxID=50990 RepID=A0A4Y7PSW7_9AGAM|nr:hypothetical protein BD410DRAFT_806823 [Rickenella mellea]